MSFNPRTPCGVRQIKEFCAEHLQAFQSTHSLRSATFPTTNPATSCPVSIHALLAECDSVGPVRQGRGMGFNPRTPCGVRPEMQDDTARDDRFQSTHSLRSATAENAASQSRLNVSIHALLAECDFLGKNALRQFAGFQSTHSLRSATVLDFSARAPPLVSIHALLAECDG